MSKAMSRVMEAARPFDGGRATSALAARSWSLVGPTPRARLDDMASVLLHLPEGTDFFDPDPAATIARDVDLVAEWDESVIGVVGWSDAGLSALPSLTIEQALQATKAAIAYIRKRDRLHFDAMKRLCEKKPSLSLVTEKAS